MRTQRSLGSSTDGREALRSSNWARVLFWVARANFLAAPIRIRYPKERNKWLRITCSRTGIRASGPMVKDSLKAKARTCRIPMRNHHSKWTNTTLIVLQGCKTSLNWIWTNMLTIIQVTWSSKGKQSSRSGTMRIVRCRTKGARWWIEASTLQTSCCGLTTITRLLGK